MKAAAVCVLVLCCLAASHAWTCREGPRLYNVQQVDAGLGEVVGVDKYNRVYFLAGTYWSSLGRTSLKHVSVGSSGIWGCSSNNTVYKFIAGQFTRASGLYMQQLDAGADVVGISTSNNNTYCMPKSRSVIYNGVGSTSWYNLYMSLMYVSCGNDVCWGVHKNTRIYATKITSSSTCTRSGWRQVSGLLAMVEVSDDGQVFGVSPDGKVFQRIGISSSNYMGTAWREVPMCMPIRHVSYNLRNLWIVTRSNLLMICTP